MISALIPGFALTLLIGVTSYFIANLQHSLDAVFVALLLGMFLRLAFGKSRSFGLVVAYAKDMTRYLIPVGVVFYAATLGFHKTLKLPASTFVTVVLCGAAALIVGLVLGYLLKMKPKMTWLTAVGSAICGASAIAILTGAVDADEEDASNALVAVTVAGIIALVVYKFFLAPALTPEKYAVLSGATLQQTGLVKMATASLGALQKDLALPVKVIKTALIPFVALAFLWIKSRKEPASGGNTGMVVAVLVAFIVILGLSGFVPAVAELANIKALKMAATIVFAVAFANLGLLVEPTSLRLKPIFVALVSWLSAAGVFFLLA